MLVENRTWTAEAGWSADAALSDANVVIYFAEREALAAQKPYDTLKEQYPQATIVGATTGGEIQGAEVLDNSIVVSAMKLEKTSVRSTSVIGHSPETSFGAGRALAEALKADDLSYVIVLSDGLNVNGADLVRGLYSVLPENVIVTGGLAGDGADFKETRVGVNAHPTEKTIAAIGFYGDAIKVNYGSVGGWQTFGPERKVTKASGNVLYEMDGEPALALYKKYLGEDADNLPASGLLFPLGIREDENSDYTLVRTMVGISEEEQSITFAGEIKEGMIARLMWANFDDLVEGAETAAGQANVERKHAQSLAILVSCIGRKLLMGQSISDETEAVAEALGADTPTIGFYSYGEICHDQFTGKCNLHNQTMTVTVLYES